MTAAVSPPILFEKGADFKLLFTLRDETTKVVTNLTGCIPEFLVAAKQGGPELFEVPTTLSATPTDGTFEANYPKESIDLLTIKEGFFVINITWSNGDKERLVEGRLVISKGVQ